MTNKRRTTSTNPAVSNKKPSRFSDWLTTERLIIGGSLGLTAVIIGVIVVISGQRNYVTNAVIDGIQIISGLVATHTDAAVEYPQTPPAGGPHNAVWQTCGVYVEPLVNEHAVHSLEHGAVWITYQPDLPADQLQTLQDLTRRGTHRLLSPYPGIDSPIVVSAWGYQLHLERADDPRLGLFIAKYEQGPSTPELGATCSGGETRTVAQLSQ
ncbi:MAG: DUF3105 domain-containing protein [Anaerolineae bacterium]|nr:DUF3105 domain-containing protein [Anaerolineae bacterium]